ncbi:hypothetical protein Tco_0974281 [Tanacetum coccineum]|uniref:Uncharacterized protein n=1 Tax=Tanacetum coccineum TaxID=301880 RepID=A0ABQ5EB48_9ASTR
MPRESVAVTCGGDSGEMMMVMMMDEYDYDDDGCDGGGDVESTGVLPLGKVRRKSFPTSAAMWWSGERAGGVGAGKFMRRERGLVE